MENQNPNSILLLYEGDTEQEFYELIFEKFIPSRSIRISYDNLKGISTNINKKVIGKILKHIKNNPDLNAVNVFIAIDREGDRTNDSPLDLDVIINKVNESTDQVSKIHEIIATQGIESWFFIDIDGIYNYLRAPKNRRNPQKYSNYESFDKKKLSQLFRLFGRAYIEGHRCEKFLKKLDLEKIYNNCIDLQSAIEKIINLC